MMWRNVVPIVALMVFSSTTGQQNLPSHHTAYGSAFGVPSHGSQTFLSSIGARSLSSVLTALGIGPTLTRNAAPSLSSTSSQSSGNVGVPTFLLNTRNTRNQNSNSRPIIVRTSQPSSTRGITSRRTDSSLTFPNRLSSRFELSPPPAFPSNSQAQSSISLEPQSVNLLNNILTNMISPSSSSPVNSLARQSPFVVILPENGSSQGGSASQPARVIMNVDPNLQSSNTFFRDIFQTNTGSQATTADIISNLAALMRANGIQTDLQAGTQTGTSPQIFTISPQRLSPSASSTASPQDTPSSATASSKTPSAAATPSNKNTLDTIVALAESSPKGTASRLKNPNSATSANATTKATDPAAGGPTVQDNKLPTFPGPNTTAAEIASRTGASATPTANKKNASSLLTASKTATGNTVSAVSKPASPSLSAKTKTKTKTTSSQKVSPKATMIVPVAGKFGQPGGVYMYQFSISGADGITRHEMGEVSPGLRNILRTFSPAFPTAGGTPTAKKPSRTGTAGSTKTKPGAGSTKQATAGQTLAGAASKAASVTESPNIFGNYSYVAPDGKVFKVHYTHGPPSFVAPAPPPAVHQEYYAGAHPFEFLINKLSGLSVYHNLPTGGSGTATKKSATAPATAKAKTKPAAKKTAKKPAAAISASAAA